MKKICSICATIFLSLSLFFAIQLAFAQEFPPEEPETPQMPGRVEGTGTHFEITDSEYLNITLDSTEEICLTLESVPEMVTMHLESASGATSAFITLGGFPPSETFYRYEDDYHNGVAFTTDVWGNYSYVQDLSMLHLVFIQPRPGTRFIPTDTEIGTWDGVTRTYTLITDVSETIQIDQDDLTLDGDGHRVIGPGSGYGVCGSYRTGITIRNLNISNFTCGICVSHFHNGTISNNIADSNEVHAISLVGCHNNVLDGNIVSNNQYGIYTQWYCTGNTITANTASNNGCGIYLWEFRSGTITANTASGNNICGIYLHGWDTTLTGNILKSNEYGINLSGERNTLRNNISSNNRYGIYLAGAHNTLIDNTFTSNTDYGIYSTWYRSGYTLTSNIVSNNGDGIYLWEFRDSVLTGNTFDSNNGCGIFLHGWNNTLADNTIDSNTGCGITLYQASNNVLTGNTASNNPYGIRVGYSNSNQIYNNNFVNNTMEQARVESSSGNIFSLDKPIGGNYWSDWTSPDEDGDGFVDDPYVFTGGQDDLPWTRQDGWENEPPVAYSGPDQTVIVDETVQFDGSGSSDPDGTIDSYEWDFGDGTPTQSGVAVTHAYSTEGIYTVTLTVTDDDDATGTDTAIVTVLTHEGAINDLVSIIEEMNLQQGIDNSLDAKLDAALSALDDLNEQNDVAAINALQAFINAVEAQRGNKLTDEQADILVSYANRIIGALSSPATAPAFVRVIPSEFQLAQNYPNPFNPETWIPFQLAQDAEVVIRIYDIRGQLTRTLDLGHKEAGFHRDRGRAAYWDGRNEGGEEVSSGIYFIVMRAGEFTAARKMLMLK